MRPIRLLTMALIASLALGGCSGATEKSDVGIQLFMFNWNSVARECSESLGPAGISWVLVSPPQEHISDSAWWVHYQPVSYKIESRLGTRSEFQNMVQSCKRAGVDVIADAVINHMTGASFGNGWAGSKYEKYDYPGIYQRSDFHDCGLSENNQIADFSNREQVQNCELLGLADLDTSSDKVQQQIIAYLQDLLALGVAGFRIDAAKHISMSDLEKIFSKLPSNTKILHEVIRGSGEEVQPEEYTATGKVFEFGYSSMLTSIASGMAPNLHESKAIFGFLKSKDAIAFVTNHDTERSGRALSPNYSKSEFQLASLFMLASSYGTPMLYSGYQFIEYDEPPPLDSLGKIIDADCSAEAWNCQQRDQEIIQMLKWRTETLGLKRNNFVYQDSYTAWGKGTKGFFAMNSANQEIEAVFQTQLPAGSFCNLLEIEPDGSCPTKWTVQSDGTLNLKIPALSAVAILSN